MRQAYEQAAAYARGQEPSAAAPEWIDPPLPCSEKAVQPERSSEAGGFTLRTSARRKINFTSPALDYLRSCTAPNSAETASSGTSGLPLRNS